MVVRLLAAEEGNVKIWHCWAVYQRCMTGDASEKHRGRYIKDVPQWPTVWATKEAWRVFFYLLHRLFGIVCSYVQAQQAFNPLSLF